MILTENNGNGANGLGDASGADALGHVNTDLQNTSHKDPIAVIEVLCRLPDECHTLKPPRGSLNKALLRRAGLLRQGSILVLMYILGTKC